MVIEVLEFLMLSGDTKVMMDGCVLAEEHRDVKSVSENAMM